MHFEPISNSHLVNFSLQIYVVEPIACKRYCELLNCIERNQKSLFLTGTVCVGILKTKFDMLLFGTEIQLTDTM